MSVLRQARRGRQLSTDSITTERRGASARSSWVNNPSAQNPTAGGYPRSDTQCTGWSRARERGNRRTPQCWPRHRRPAAASRTARSAPRPARSRADGKRAHGSHGCHASIMRSSSRGGVRTETGFPSRLRREQYANIEGPKTAQIIPSHPKTRKLPSGFLLNTCVDSKPPLRFGKQP